MRVRLFALLALASLLLAALSCTPEDEAFVLGVLVDLDGQAAGEADPDELHFLYGAQFAINEARAGEGDAPLAVRLQIGDLAGDPEAVRRVYDDLTSDGAGAILTSAPYADELASAAAEDGVALLSPDCEGRLSPDGEGSEALFSLRPDPALLGRAAAFLAKSDKVARAHLGADEENEYFTLASDAFRSSCAEFGVEIAQDLAFSPGDEESLREFAQNLAGRVDDGDGLFLACDFSAAMDSVADALQAAGVTFGRPILQGGGADYAPYVDEIFPPSDAARSLLSRSLCVGIYQRPLRKLPGEPSAIAFAEAYGFSFDPASYAGYAGARILLEAAHTARSGDRGAVLAAMTSLNVALPTGDLTLTSDGYAVAPLSVAKFQMSAEGKLFEAMRTEKMTVP